MNNYKTEWEQSYASADNFTFYPEYNVIWFVAKFIKRRIGLNEYQHIRRFNTALDLGCGIGSNLLFLNEYGFDSYGIDLSDNAIGLAKRRLGKAFNEKIFQASADSLPFDNDYFEFIISHGVLDSMPLETAKGAFAEAYRVLSNKGLLFVSLICSDGFRLPPEFSGETLVETEHEKNTVQ